MNHELLVLKAQLSRGMSVNEGRLKALQSGVDGEAKFRAFVLEQNLEHLIWIEDYWFQEDERPKRQSDFMLLLPYEWLVIDVKNYQTSFDYRGGKCYLNGWPDPMDNVVVLAQNRNQQLQRLANMVAPNITVRSALAFINENCHVTQDNTPCDIDLIPRTRLRVFLEQFRATPTPSQRITDSSFHTLNKYLCDYGFSFSGLKVEQFAELRKGVICGNCGAYGMLIIRSHVKCSVCGNVESKRDVVYRHALQLRYLFYDNPEMVTVGNLVKLMGGEISYATVRRIMYELFTVTGRGRASIYPIELEGKRELKRIRK